MSTTYRPRYFNEEKQNRIAYKFTGKLRLLQICLNYEGTQSPLSCIEDGKNILKLIGKKGNPDIVSLYDDGSTKFYPSADVVTEQFIAMAQRCVPGDFMVVQYSGHGTQVQDEDGDQSDGMDQAFCLRNQNGEDETFTDDEMADLVSQYINPEVPCLFIVDACHSGSILDLTKGGMWGGKKVFLISGCQDDQFSGDLGNGGIMTFALINALMGEQSVAKRKGKGASIQYVFNRMVNQTQELQGQNKDYNYDDFDYGDEEDQEFYDEEEYQWQQDYQYDEEPYVEQQQQGQIFNLSWCGGCDPTCFSFPF